MGDAVPTVAIVIGTIVLGLILLGELILEGLILRRLGRIENAWVRRALKLVTFVLFYLVACFEMAVFSLVIGVGVHWLVWLGVLLIHVAAWALGGRLPSFEWLGDMLKGIKKATMLHKAQIYDAPGGKTEANLTIDQNTPIRYRPREVAEAAGVKWVFVIDVDGWVKAEHVKFA